MRKGAIYSIERVELIARGIGIVNKGKNKTKCSDVGRLSLSICFRVV
jgi:hypothetical protein